MPTTPFIGISILVHVAIIIFHKIFKIKPREQKPVTAVTRGQYALSTLIVATMFAIMLSTAYGLISASVHEPHSTIYLVEDTAQWLASENGEAQIAAAITGAYRAQATGIAVAVVVLFAIIFTVPRIRVPQSSMSVSQGGYSLVQVSLLVSGLISFVAGATYIVIYYLIASGVR